MKELTSKILLLGSQGVGKSTMALRLSGADVDVDHIIPTVGLSYLETNVEIGDHEIKLQLWDTAGQERFKAMIPMYYRKSSAALLVYDVTDKNSFLAIQEWQADLRTHGDENLVIFVVGNKYDSEQTKRFVDQSTARAFAEAIGGHFLEVSAVSNIGLKKLKFDLCIQLIHENQRVHRMSLTSYEHVIGDNRTVYLGRKSISSSLSSQSEGGCCS